MHVFVFLGFAFVFVRFFGTNYCRDIIEYNWYKLGIFLAFILSGNSAYTRHLLGFFFCVHKFQDITGICQNPGSPEIQQHIYTIKTFHFSVNR